MNTTEQLAAALRRIASGQYTGEGCEEIAREALARYDAERTDHAEPDAAENARCIAEAYLCAVLEQGEFIVTDGPVIVEDADDDDARTYGVPVLIRVSADDAEPGQVDDDTRSNGPRR